MSGVHEVTAFLGSIGLDVCVQAVVHNGFYTSMEALKGATYEELLDCGVRPMHAKLLLSNLGVKGGATGLGAAAPADEEEEAAAAEQQTRGNQKPSPPREGIRVVVDAQSVGEAPNLTFVYEARQRSRRAFGAVVAGRTDLARRLCRLHCPRAPESVLPCQPASCARRRRAGGAWL